MGRLRVRLCGRWSIRCQLQEKMQQHECSTKLQRSSMIHLTASAQDHVNAYLEYDRIVGDADGGKLFSEEEYAVFKANAIAHRADRIYVSATPNLQLAYCACAAAHPPPLLPLRLLQVSWRCMSSGMDCRQVGPTSPCFCGHRFKQHATDNTNKNIFCKQAGCPCKLYDYIPVRGTQDVKCVCKHSYDTHNVTGKRKCKTGGCTCAGFHTSISCSCREQYSSHTTVFETREERQASGRPVDNLAGGGAGYEALGGLTSFSSLVDGIDRMAIGPSGQPELVGAPPPRKALTQEDEFALYDAKYKKGGSAASSSVSRGRSGGAAATRSAAAATPTSSLEHQGHSAGSAAQAGGGGQAHQLFHTSVAGDSQHVIVSWSVGDSAHCIVCSSAGLMCAVLIVFPLLNPLLAVAWVLPAPV
jgi:hypothetical protein